jgi:uncharacterized protein YjgD (DUF1641 family)
LANPLPFKPAPHDPHVELARRVAAAPRDHAEALLAAWETLQTAHDKGVLDLVHGLIGGRDAIASKLAEAGNQPETIAALRNAISLARILASLDPATLDHLAKALDGAAREAESHAKPPGLWTLAKRAFSADSRRGISWMLTVVSALGRSTTRD